MELFLSIRYCCPRKSVFGHVLPTSFLFLFDLISIRLFSISVGCFHAVDLCPSLVGASTSCYVAVSTLQSSIVLACFPLLGILPKGWTLTPQCSVLLSFDTHLLFLPNRPPPSLLFLAFLLLPPLHSLLRGPLSKCVRTFPKVKAGESDPISDQTVIWIGDLNEPATRAEDLG